MQYPNSDHFVLSFSGFQKYMCFYFIFFFYGVAITEERQLCFFI